MKTIPLHLLKDKTNLGLHLKYFEKGEVFIDDEVTSVAHRDDHYIFFLLESGSGSVMIDFVDVPLPEKSLYYILPTQVHQRIQNQNANGWFIAVDTALLPPECRSIFENTLILQQPYLLHKDNFQQFQKLLGLLLLKYSEDNTSQFYLMSVHSLLQSFIAIAATCYSVDMNTQLIMSRPMQLRSQFKNLLTNEIREVKSPGAYAAKLNISEAYLSEILKKRLASLQVTGYSRKLLWKLNVYYTTAS